MVDQSIEKSKKVEFDALLLEGYKIYLRQAEILQDKGYCTEYDTIDLARKIYNSKWRVDPL